jgi:hypothetical protein
MPVYDEKEKNASERITPLCSWGALRGAFWPPAVGVAGDGRLMFVREPCGFCLSGLTFVGLRSAHAQGETSPSVCYKIKVAGVNFFLVFLAPNAGNLCLYW